MELVPADGNGGIDTTALAEVLGRPPSAPTIVCLQAGDGNTGAVDPLRAATDPVHEHVLARLARPVA